MGFLVKMTPGSDRDSYNKALNFSQQAGLDFQTAARFSSLLTWRYVSPGRHIHNTSSDFGVLKAQNSHRRQVRVGTIQIDAVPLSLSVAGKGSFCSGITGNWLELGKPRESRYISTL